MDLGLNPGPLKQHTVTRSIRPWLLATIECYIFEIFHIKQGSMINEFLGVLSKKIANSRRVFIWHRGRIPAASYPRAISNPKFKLHRKKGVVALALFAKLELTEDQAHTADAADAANAAEQVPDCQSDEIH